jgi:hypothetical protein
MTVGQQNQPGGKRGPVPGAAARPGPSLDEMRDSRSPDYAVPTCTAEGLSVSWLASPSEYSLGMVGAELQDGTSLHWGDVHGDEALYVQDGSLEYNGQLIGPGGCLIVESAVPAVAIARSATRTKIVHGFPFSPGPAVADNSAHGVHVLTAEDSTELKDDDEVDLRVTKRYADSKCATCTINIFYQSFGRHHDTIAHSHKTDELIMILGGEIRVGEHAIVPGMTVAIPARFKYSLRSGPIGWAFLNYRAEQPGLEVSDAQRALGRAPTDAELAAMEN